MAMNTKSGIMRSPTNVNNAVQVFFWKLVIDSNESYPMWILYHDIP